jgi:hypothetical protein
MIITLKQFIYIYIQLLARGYSLVVEHLLSMCEALVPSLAPHRKKFIYTYIHLYIHIYF